MKKIIVAHPNRQHSFRLATALNNDELLFKYITTVYDKNSSILMSVVKKVLKGDNLKRATGRKCEGLNDEDVEQFCEIKGLIELLLLRIDKSRYIYKLWSRYTFNSFGKKVANYAIKNNVDAVIMYDSTSNKCFEILKKKAPHIKRIMDSSTANREYIREIYQNEINNTGDSSYIYENKELWNYRMMKRFNEEVKNTDFFLVPSNFVRESFLFSKVKKEQIHILPYGSNIINTNKKIYNNEKLKFLFVGQITSRKGIKYLLDAFCSLDDNNVELNIVGNVINDIYIKKQYKNINFIGHVTHDRMKEIYDESDIFIFPSLLEGMTLSGLEAMGCGLPIICTTNTGINDIVEDGINGFVIEPSNTLEIIEKVKWFINNRDKIPQMGINAQQTIQKYTWETYNKNATNIVRKICN